MIKIAVTGGLSSGKSTVCQFFAELGACYISADEIVHAALSNNENVKQKIVDLLGPEIKVKGILDRQAMAEKAFSDAKTLKSLESILHPVVFHEIQSHYQKAKNNPKYNLFVAEVPLLYETNKQKLFDYVIVTLTSPELCKQRHLNKTTFTERMSHQMSPEDKARKADFILFNNGSLQELKNKVTNIATTLQRIKCKKEIF